MIISYFKIGLRYLVKNRTFSIINIFSLTVGFLCFILIALYVHDELNFDMFHRDAKKTYRILQQEQNEDGSVRKVATVASRVGPESVKQFPELIEVVRLSALGRITMGNDPANRDYEATITTDPNFFTFFDFKLLEGNAQTALESPNAIVISKKIAEKYFGNEPALGKQIWTSLTIDTKPVYMTVTGVMEAFPKNSHLNLDIVFSDPTWPTIFPWYEKFMNSDWVSNSFITYVKANPGADINSIEEKITALTKTNYPPDKVFKSEFSLQRLQDIHMYSNDIQGNASTANGIKPFYIYMFSAVAFLILVIACLNYMNLSTAAAYKRTREIGTRKTLGAFKSQLIIQFSGEAVLLSFVSLFLALSFLQVLLPFVNNFAEKDLSLSQLPVSWSLLIVTIVLLAGIGSSLYPAFVISRVRPVQALKKDVHVGASGLPLRKMLIVAQFSISITMIASTLIIYRQLQFVKEKDLGFEYEKLVVIDINSGALRRNFENIKAEFGKVAEVKRISTSTRVPGEWKSFPITTVQQPSSTISSEMVYVGIDDDFLETYDIKLLEGRNFTTSRSDSTKVILTELAVKELNLKNPIGQVIEIPSVRWDANVEKLEQPFKVEVIGVAQDFHFESLRQKMMPVIFAAPNTPIHRIDYYTMKIETSDLQGTLKKLQAVNNSIDSDNPLEYTFLDDRFEEFYTADEKRGQIFLAFSALIVLIACLGLFALVSYSIEGRKKEIGIRKVLGASVESIVTMVSKEFIILVVIASVIAIPLAFLMMKSWLEDFSYHIDMSVGVFLIAGVIAVLISLLTIGVRSFKAATANPVDSLRND